jgi:hypothetical protein
LEGAGGKSGLLPRVHRLPKERQFFYFTSAKSEIQPADSCAPQQGQGYFHVAMQQQSFTDHGGLYLLSRGINDQPIDGADFLPVARMHGRP